MRARNVEKVEVLADLTAEPEQRVRLVLDMTRAEAEALANAPRTAGGDLYADQAREVAEPIAAALVAAGLGA